MRFVFVCLSRAAVQFDDGDYQEVVPREDLVLQMAQPVDLLDQVSPQIELIVKICRPALATCRLAGQGEVARQERLPYLCERRQLLELHANNVTTANHDTYLHCVLPVSLTHLSLSPS